MSEPTQDSGGDRLPLLELTQPLLLSRPSPAPVSWIPGGKKGEQTRLADSDPTSFSREINDRLIYTDNV